MPTRSLLATPTQLKAYVHDGIKIVEDFFGRAYPRKFSVHVFSDRSALNKQWQIAWNYPDFESQCWMVASGVATRLDMLSPSVWSEQACEHDPADEDALQKLVTHELIHVFHGQLNASPNFDNVKGIDWLIEGMAVYASGQLDNDRLTRAKAFLETNGKVPLSKVWTGANRYGLAGSLVSYIDKEFGRKVLYELLSFSTLSDVLTRLELSEKDLVDKWVADVISA